MLMYTISYHHHSSKVNDSIYELVHKGKSGLYAGSSSRGQKGPPHPMGLYNI